MYSHVRLQMLWPIRVTNVHLLKHLSGQTRSYTSARAGGRSGVARKRLSMVDTNQAQGPSIHSMKSVVGGMDGIQNQTIRGIHRGGRPGHTAPYKITPVISTLKRENLRPGDFIALLGKFKPRIYSPVSKEEESQTKGILSGDGRLALSTLHYRSGRFPNNSRGFLYYHIPPGQPPTSGELRLRVTPNNDPASFDEGHDLARPDGFYWRIQLLMMPEGLRDLAVRDGLITPHEVAECKRLVQWKRMNRMTFQYYLEQPFFLDFAAVQLSLMRIKDGSARGIDFYNPIRERRPLWCDPKNQHGVAAYKGSAVARFELSTLPEHVGANMIVVRILRILQPVECVLLDYDGHQEQPKAGSLITTYEPTGGRRIFTINLARNETSTVGLKVFLPGVHDLRPRDIERAISTLDPDRIQSSDVLRFNEGQRTLPISLGNGVGMEITLPRLPPGHPSRQRLNSPGFLYYYKPPGVPDTAGEIRIRLTPTPDPSTFDQGRDLENFDGRMWRVPLLRLASDAWLDPLCQKIVQDRLVTPSLVMLCKNLMLSRGILWRMDPHILHTLSQPFQLDFSRKRTTLHIVGHDVTGQWVFSHKNKELGQFTGRAWVRFEESQEDGDIGKRVVVLRVLAPAELDELGIANDTAPTCPVQTPPYGLLIVTTLGGKRHPFKMRVDKSQLRLLWPDVSHKETVVGRSSSPS